MHKFRYFLPVCLLVGLGMAGGCGRHTASAPAASSVESVLACDSLPKAVKQVVKAVAANDSSALSRLIEYPLERPYPLHNIADAKAFMAYYPTLVDDSLRRVITGSGPSAWEEFGWRGWSLSDGQYLWLDTRIYSVTYLSRREQQLTDSLSRLEIASLAPSLRGAWKPVTCLKAREGDAVYRIDLAADPHKGPAYRLAKFDSPAAMRSQPAKVLSGYIETEGSAMLVTYHFRGKDGETVEYSPDPVENSSPSLLVTGPDGSTVEIEVIPAYWLDLLPKQER